MVPPPPHRSGKSDEDEIMALPPVPRVRTSRRNTTAAKEPKHYGRTQRSKRSSTEPDQKLRRGKRKRVLESVHSDDDENSEESYTVMPKRRNTRVGRRTKPVRKVIEDELDDAEESGADEHVDDMEDEITPVKKKRTKGKRNSNASSLNTPSSISSPKEDDDEDTPESSESSPKTDDKDSDSNDKDSDPKEGSVLLEHKLNGEEDDEDDVFSEDEEMKMLKKKKPERLTRRQRAMQGEKIEIEYKELKPKSKKKKKAPVDEETSNDEQAEMKKQQRARLRQMILEKRNKEKRAAMVDKVLRGVTSKRKKVTKAAEERKEAVGMRLRANEMREGCIRFVSNRQGTSVSIPQAVEMPPVFAMSVKAVYPRPCTRDPRTGKRIFTDV